MQYDLNSTEIHRLVEAKLDFILHSKSHLNLVET